MSFCRELRNEFRLSKFGFRGVKKERFINFQWRLPVALYLAYRLVLMVYAVFWLAYVTLYRPTTPQIWSAYLTNWSYVLLNVYLISHCLLAFGLHISQWWRRATRRGGYCCRRPSLESHIAMFIELDDNREENGIIACAMLPSETMGNRGGGDEEYQFSGTDEAAVPDVDAVPQQLASPPWFACIVWVVFSAISSAALMVSIVFFSFLFPRMKSYPNINMVNLQVHILNSVIILLEHCVSATPVRLLHVLYPFLYGITYMAFSIIYWAVDNRHVIYPGILDWNKPAATAVYVFLIGFVFVPMLHIFFFMLYKLKMRIALGLMATNTTTLLSP